MSFLLFTDNLEESMVKIAEMEKSMEESLDNYDSSSFKEEPKTSEFSFEDISLEEEFSYSDVLF